jgi:glycosyltransferase involved in cell wall biosynthesis
VVIPLFNKEKEVLRAVNSVLKQTISNFEVIVVNDGSSDKGPDIVSAIRDPRIRVIDQANLGVSAARNRGIAEAKAELIAFLDADDEWIHDFLGTIMESKREFPGCSIFATSYFLVNQYGIKRPAVIRGLPKGFKKGILENYFKIAAKSDPPLWTSAVAVKKSTISSVGGFPVGIVSGEDLFTWARLASKFDIAYYFEPKAFFWKSDSFFIRPSRRPNIPDFVGHGLSLLINEGRSQKTRGLKQYLALWHRMRAIFFMQLNEQIHSIKEIWLAFKYSPSLKLCLLFLIALLPLNFSRKILSIVKRR